MIDWQRLVAYGVAIAVALAAAWGYGYNLGLRKLWDYKVEQQKAAVVVVTKQAAATDRIVTQYVKVKGETQIVTKEVEKEVIRYVEKNPGACLDADWRRLHDSAAIGAVPKPAGDPDATAGVPTAAAALETVTGNYAACRRNAERLVGLQGWIRAQQAVR